MRAFRRLVLGVLASVALLAAVVCPGCHLIYPFDPEAPRNAQDARGEAATTDASGDSMNDLPACPGDTPPVTTARRKCSCASPTDDCDAIPEAPTGNERDREPSLCNELLYEETFTTDPLKGGSWKTFAGGWTHTCGWLHQPSKDASLTSWVQATAPPLGTIAQDAHYLVEARFTLGATGNNQVWQVGIAARASSTPVTNGKPASYISCVVRVGSNDACADCVPKQQIINPDLRVESYNENGGYGAWPRLNPPGNFDSTAGQTYLLQLWYRPLKDKEQVNCRLYDDTNRWKRNAIYAMHAPYGAGHTKYLPTLPGSVALRTQGRAASFDYIRVFRLKTDAR